jgi:SAM-dependent methyltransferase
MENHEYQLMYQFENGYWWYRALHELVRFYVCKYRDSKASLKEPLRIFDAGCGTGKLMELLNSVGSVEGIDYSEEAIRFCKERGLGQAQQGDLNTWAPAAGAYDVLISNDVIYNAGVHNDMMVMEKFHLALRPGGMLILNLPAFESLRRRHDAAVSGKRRYRRRSMLRALCRIGFSPVCASYRLPALFCFLLLQKHLVERFMKGKAESDLKPIPAWINTLLLWLNRVENKLIAAGIPLPFGSSLFLVCKRGADTGGD